MMLSKSIWTGDSHYLQVETLYRCSSHRHLPGPRFFVRGNASMPWASNGVPGEQA
ncbi:uncharacterized protein PHALS_06153 [Plasmopara halstedii]|uniref:Uncharacterized protein n=1 Tax=Plasmopara halstedii TaxID=4781 RepID=A0A0P1B2S7_PLAHL|nr:uncharacterized protein PHALS_06153 [Plasmopara halstedii]CEG48326.1 hypothetical protein PHALS_06153 [Plasmopara halstedii]|eukprot:XP_024584695.1 hypothetical protein PHALS_06153 [Plasmopara halstedii]